MRSLAAMVHAGESRFRGETGITLEAGELTATFLPDVGMTGVSLRFRGREHLALPGGVAQLRAGGTAGLPLLAPWANRLASRRYRAAGVAVDLAGLPLGTDPNGLPIHGLLVGAPGWQVDRADVRGKTARLQRVDRCRCASLPLPAPDRGRGICTRRRARCRDHRHPHRTTTRARRVRLAPVPPAAWCSTEPMAAAAARPPAPGPRLVRYSDGRRGRGESGSSAAGTQDVR